MGRAAHVGVFAVPGRRDRAAADAAMDRVGITELADRAFPTLSGGEQQLVLVARAVASGHPVMVLDEPATGLDLGNQGLVLGPRPVARRRRPDRAADDTPSRPRPGRL